MIRQVATVVCALMTPLGAMYGQAPGSAPAGDFSANYVSLKPEQKALVDDWFKRFSATIQKKVDPQEAYDNLPLSTKTTFNAVTHALISTKLTDASGGSLGPAIQIIDKLDTVRGELPGTRGDEQFRIYVQLKPGAMEVLAKSQEFQRMQDNTVYHKGYPICYRSKPAVPSIQVSATKDETMADVDVDYRASGFPKGLVNGHLSAANSDVRAGQNDEIHNDQWQGLNPWWRSLLSLPLAGQAGTDKGDAGGKVSEQAAARAGMKPADAVFDMLNTWLVKKDAEDVLFYFSRQAYACEELERGGKVDYGMARFVLLRAMQRANERFGSVGQLGDISTAVPLKTTGARSKLVQQPHQGQFTLYDVREDAAEQFKCVNRLDASQISSKAAASKAFGKYYGAVFRLGPKSGSEQTTLATLWARDGKVWKLISYDVDPVWDEYQAPDTAKSQPKGAPTVLTVAPAELVTAGERFLDAWLVKHDVDAALNYVATECDACVRLNRNADQSAESTEDARMQLKKAMQNVLETTGSVKRLEEASVAAKPNHEDLKLVKHKNSKAFALVSIPDYMASALECKNRNPQEPVRFHAATGEKSQGKYYAMGLRLAKAGEDSATLWAVWAQEGTAWKIVSYTVLTP